MWPGRLAWRSAVYSPPPQPAQAPLRRLGAPTSLVRGCERSREHTKVVAAYLLAAALGWATASAGPPARSSRGAGPDTDRTTPPSHARQAGHTHTEHLAGSHTAARTHTSVSRLPCLRTVSMASGSKRSLSHRVWVGASLSRARAPRTRSALPAAQVRRRRRPGAQASVRNLVEFKTAGPPAGGHPPDARSSGIRRAATLVAPRAQRAAAQC